MLATPSLASSPSRPDTGLMAEHPRDPDTRFLIDIGAGDVPGKVAAPKGRVPGQGRKGGLKGGKARAEKLTKAQRVAIAKLGAKARWARWGKDET